jgi:pimeloyl-ACP methyl ester carboxylesterase
MRAFDAYDRLGGMQMPTLILHGTEDRIVAPANAERLAAAIPGAELRWLEGAGHLYHSEQAQAADAAVLEFIRRHP